MDRWTGRVALVTGASAGIGASCCRKLVECGLIVVGCARSVEKIQKLAEELVSAKGKLHPYKCDLSKEEEVASLFTWIKNTLGGVDVCINNAGFGDFGSLLGPEASVAGWRNMLDVNVVALCQCTKEAVNSMRERGVDDGQIIHINSLSGHRVPVGVGNKFYSATKYAVTSLTEGHRQELRELQSNIRVAAISPGFVATDFFETATHGNTKNIDELFRTMKPIEPIDIADAVVYILSTPPHVQVHDIMMRPTAQKT